MGGTCRRRGGGSSHLVHQTKVQRLPLTPERRAHTGTAGGRGYQEAPWPLLQMITWAFAGAGLAEPESALFSILS